MKRAAGLAVSRRITAARVVGGCGFLGVLLLGACSAQAEPPSYDTVRTDTLTAVAEIIATVPSNAVVAQRPDGEPYACKTGDSSGAGYIYTGQWDITFSASTDVAELIDALPASAGDQWTVTKGSLPRTATYVDVTESEKHVGVSVTDASDPTFGPRINILATSVCGKKSSG